MEENQEQEYETLHIGGADYKTTFNKMYNDRKKYQKPDPRILTAFIPGIISETSVKKGKKVKEGEQMMILEAMKMKNTILAPFDGVVKSVNVKDGEMVPKNTVLIVLE